MPTWAHECGTPYAHTITSPTARTMAHHPQGRVGWAKFNRGYSVMKVAKVSHHPPQPKGFECVHIKRSMPENFNKIFLKRFWERIRTYQSRLKVVLFFIPKSSMHHNIELRTRMLKTQSIIGQLQKEGVQSNIFHIRIYIYTQQRTVGSFTQTRSHNLLFL